MRLKKVVLRVMKEVDFFAGGDVQQRHPPGRPRMIEKISLIRRPVVESVAVIAHFNWRAACGARLTVSNL
jgi:hypothetical protein